MISIALRSKWLIATFVAGTLINFLQFLSVVAILSLSASLIWTYVLLIDVVLMRFLRDDHRLKSHKLPPISFEGCEYEPFVERIRECITEYLSSEAAVTAEWAAETLDGMLPANQYLRVPEVYVPSSVTFAWRLWETIVHFAFQIPHDHYKQEMLVKLVLALSERPAVLVRHRNTLLRFWDAMPEYNLFITVYGSMFYFDEDWSHDEDMTHQTNLMAFLARVQATGLPYGLMFGLGSSLHAALREDKRQVLHWAALWIEHCAEYLWWFVSQDCGNDFVFSKRSWMYYMAKFDKLASDGRNSRTIRMLAQDSFRIMARLTGSAPNPKFDNIGQRRWETILAREGPQGVFEEPIAPDLWVEDAEVGNDGDVYAGEYVLDLNGQDPHGYHPLRPLAGFSMYSNVTNEDESIIAQAA